MLGSWCLSGWPGVPLRGEARNHASSGGCSRGRGRSVGGSSWHYDARNDAYDAWNDDATDDDASHHDSWDAWRLAYDASSCPHDAHDDAGDRGGQSGSGRICFRECCAKQK